MATFLQAGSYIAEGKNMPLDISKAVVKGVDPSDSDSSKIKPKLDNAISSDAGVVIKKQPKKEIDTSKISLDSDVEGSIKKTDSKNSDKHLNDYKKLLESLQVPDNFRREIEKYMKNGRNVSDVLTAYEFINDNYGDIKELGDIIDKKSKGKAFKDLFKEYNSSHKEFVPTDFKPGYLEDLMKTPGITADDIMIADRISQKGSQKFEDLIEMRKQGKTWMEINSGLGILNTSDKLAHIAITKLQVKNYMDQTGLKEDQVLDALVLAGKLDKDNDEIVNKVKAGEKKEDILAEAYDEKYR
jgi:hypothetical protein